MIGIERVIPQLEWTVVRGDQAKIFSRRIQRTLWLCFDVKQYDAANVVSFETFNVPYAVSVIKLTEGKSLAGISKEVNNSNTICLPIGTSCKSAIKENIEKLMRVSGQEIPKEGITMSADFSPASKKQETPAKKRRSVPNTDEDKGNVVPMQESESSPAKKKKSKK